MTRPDRARLDDPTAEDTADTSTETASGLSGGAVPPAAREMARDSIPRLDEQPADEDAVMPSDDSSLNTKI